LCGGGIDSGVRRSQAGECEQSSGANEVQGGFGHLWAPVVKQKQRDDHQAWCLAC
jgi:hypothetical protein